MSTGKAFQYAIRLVPTGRSAQKQIAPIVQGYADHLERRKDMVIKHVLGNFTEAYDSARGAAIRFHSDAKSQTTSTNGMGCCMFIKYYTPPKQEDPEQKQRYKIFFLNKIIENGAFKREGKEVQVEIDLEPDFTLDVEPQEMYNTILSALSKASEDLKNGVKSD
ncbi:hypothetical protein MIND_01197300 [Mycena indigotica]|uniref:Uncharacterized protein n=1 Tax=Mycena indigotica TaxID=2126181 RepID=A0A8H6S687_9AGAR|nr:uncharacterized protein MIND_01197300 [Mycena indigotica]KAF7292980.1 hypothetical protein MIND_01197300 [Mycena indigotica]